LFDCRFDLVDSEAGYKSYLEGHIPGAIYVHSDKDLASEKMVAMADIHYQALAHGKNLCRAGYHAS